MRKTITILLTSIFCITIITGLTGCGSDAAQQKIDNSDQEKQRLKDDLANRQSELESQRGKTYTNPFN